MQLTANSQTTVSREGAHQEQTITNTDYGYRVPFLEDQAQHERAQISLIDQRFVEFMYGQNLSHLVEVFRNELTAIDSDILQLQNAFLNSLLLSPISGVVTGLYRHPGEAVRAGETVLRVENNETLLLVAKLVYRGPVGTGHDPEGRHHCSVRPGGCARVPHWHRRLGPGAR